MGWKSRIVSALAILFNRRKPTEAPATSASDTVTEPTRDPLGLRAAGYLSLEFGFPNAVHDAPTTAFDHTVPETMIAHVPPDTVCSGRFFIDNFSWSGNSIRFRFVYYGSGEERLKPICSWFGYSILNNGAQITAHHLTDLSSMDPVAAQNCSRIYNEWAHHFSTVLRRKFRPR